MCVCVTKRHAVSKTSILQFSAPAPLPGVINSLPSRVNLSAPRLQQPLNLCAASDCVCLLRGNKRLRSISGWRWRSKLSPHITARCRPCQHTGVCSHVGLCRHCRIHAWHSRIVNEKKMFLRVDSFRSVSAKKNKNNGFAWIEKQNCVSCYCILALTWNCWILLV